MGKQSQQTGDDDSQSGSKQKMILSRLARKLKTWMEQYHGHVYGLIGVVGVVLGAVALFAPSRANGDVHLTVDKYTREQIEERVERYRSLNTLPQAEPSATRINVTPETIPDMSQTGVRIIKHEVVADFNHFRELASIDRASPESAVIQHVKYQILKTDETDKFRANAFTSGIDVFLDSQLPIRVYSGDLREKFGPYDVKKRVIEFDIEAYPINSEFTLQHKKTYWNAFQGDDQSWAGYEVRLPTNEIEYLIVFPEDKPFADIEFYANNADGKRRRLDREAYVVMGDDKTWIWWRAVKPKTGTSYNVDWEW